MKKTFILLAMFVMLISCFFGKTLVMANAEENLPASRRYYTSVEIKKGDSLWSIANTYRKGSGMSTKEYLKELKQINQIIADDIQAGDSITIVYYADEPMEIKR